MHSPGSAERRVDPRALGLSATLWVAAFLLPFSTPPITVFANHWLAVIGWGILLCAAVGASRGRLGASAGVFLLALMGLALAAASQQGWVSVCMLLLAAGTFVFGATEEHRRPMRVLWVALLAAGLASAVIASVQVLVPSAAGTSLIANLGTPGRAAGNLRQPNLLASLLALSLVALIGLTALSNWQRRSTLILAAALLGAGVEFTGSRTGILELGLVVVWVVACGRLPRSARMLALASLAGLAVGMALQWLAAQSGAGVFYAGERMESGAELTTGRTSIWSDVLSLIAGSPWTGVGWGGLSRAWALSENASRHPAFFDHAHNLVLQLAVEIGIPATVLCLAALGWLLWRAAGALRSASAEDLVFAHCSAAMLLLLGVHSMLEYPLWYSYFLLPAAYLLGVLLRLGERVRQDNPDPRGTSFYTRGVQFVGVLTVLGALFAVWDYGRVLQIYAPFGRGLQQSFEQRVEAGRKSLLFGYLADYGLVTSVDHPGEVLGAFDRPMHHLINARLLLAYAKALEERGMTEKARYVAQRLREFRSPLSAQYFAACQSMASGQAPPYQCDPPASAFTFEDFP
jgi:O-antigen ligase